MNNYDDLAPWEDSFTYKGASYVVREASGGAGKKYKAASLAGAEFSFNDDDGTRTIKRMEALSSAESLLVSLCVFEVKDGKEFPVNQATVESWPNRMVKHWHDQIKEHSELDEKEDLPSLLKQKQRLEAKIKRLQEDQVKNLQSATAGTSA